MTAWKRGRLLAAWCLGLYLAVLYIRMGRIKLDPQGFWTAAFTRWGYPPWLRVAVGLVDVAWISAYLLGLLWIAYEWRDFRFWKRRA